MIAAQLVQRMLLTLEVSGSNPINFTYFNFDLEWRRGLVDKVLALGDKV